jgi:hypothetical protein
MNVYKKPNNVGECVKPRSLNELDNILDDIADKVVDKLTRKFAVKLANKPSNEKPKQPKMQEFAIKSFNEKSNECFVDIILESDCILESAIPCPKFKLNIYREMNKGKNPAKCMVTQDAWGIKYVRYFI